MGIESAVEVNTVYYRVRRRHRRLSKSKSEDLIESLEYPSLTLGRACVLRRSLLLADGERSVFALGFERAVLLCLISKFRGVWLRK